MMRLWLTGLIVPAGCLGVFFGGIADGNVTEAGLGLVGFFASVTTLIWLPLVLRRGGVVGHGRHSKGRRTDTRS